MTSEQPGVVSDTAAAAQSPHPVEAPVRARKLLLFGAYANGNIGDQFQGNAVAYHLQRHLPGVETYATSNSSARKPYEYDARYQLADPNAIADPDVVNAHDALVIGGGGLLASVHRPLNSVTWLERIKIPIFLFAVGASADVVEKCRDLVQRATVVTARDSFSFDILSPVRPDVQLLHDPILMDDRLDAPAQRERQELHRLCIIPRKQTDKNEVVYKGLGALMKSRDRVVSVFPATDEKSGALASFGAVKVVETWKMAELTAAIDASTDVVSERYHGCIVALKRRVPSIGLINADDQRRSKIGELYKQVGHEHLLLSYRKSPLSRQEIISRLQNEYDEGLVSSKLASIRGEFDATLKSVLSKLGMQ